MSDTADQAAFSQAERKLIFGQEKPERRLEIATLAALRDWLRSADIWVDGNRSFRPVDEHLPHFSKPRRGITLDAQSEAILLLPVKKRSRRKLGVNRRAKLTP
ncbi:hypothetical protein NKJ36_31885 [Mesorhizobium sp. M0142]|uniref:hypothetical protein n=1 Tax=Mesorhizobium sp. M0142 TaxID=2956894 RepID=UPI0033383F30